jgi:biotin transporter BioY
MKLKVLGMTVSSSWRTKIRDNPLFRGFLLFAAFRAVYGMGILVVTYFLATSQDAPWWSSLIFLAFSMVFSRLLFRSLKQRWPHVFNKNIEPTAEG